jgi:hypothetical protein
LVAVLAANAQAPLNLPTDLHCIEMPVVTDRYMLREVIGAIEQSGGLNHRSDSDEPAVGCDRLGRQ